jgi:hypothetical protein
MCVCVLSTYWSGLCEMHGTYIKILKTENSYVLSKYVPCVISDFGREINQNCALLRCYAESSDNYVPMFGFIQQHSWPVNTTRIGCSETSVRNYHYWLHNNLDERSSQISALLAIETCGMNETDLLTYMFWYDCLLWSDVWRSSTQLSRGA